MLSAPVRRWALVCIQNRTVLTSSHNGNQRRRRREGTTMEKRDKRQTDTGRADREASVIMSPIKQGTSFWSNKWVISGAALACHRWVSGGCASTLIPQWWDLFLCARNRSVCFWMSTIISEVPQTDETPNTQRMTETAHGIQSFIGNEQCGPDERQSDEEGNRKMQQAVK